MAAVCSVRVRADIALFCSIELAWLSSLRRLGGNMDRAFVGVCSASAAPISLRLFVVLLIGGPAR